LSVGTGIGKVSVDESFRLDRRATSDDNWVMEFSAGHAFASNVVVEGSGVRGATINIFGGDSYECKDDRLMAGYSFAVGSRFSIVRQLGICF
jgi:hypothetical protein